MYETDSVGYVELSGSDIHLNTLRGGTVSAGCTMRALPQVWRSLVWVARI